MRIRDRARSIVFISLFVVSVFAIVLSATNRLEEQALQRQVAAAAISEELFTRNALLTDFVLAAGVSSRIEEQLRIVDERIESRILAAGTVFRDDEALQIYGQLLESRAQVRSDLALLNAALSVRPDQGDDDTIDRQEAQLVSKILVGSQLTSDRARALAQLSRDQLAETQQRTAGIFSLTLVIIAVYGGYMSFMLIRNVVRPVQRLSGGARSMAEGDFSHRVEIDSRDELGDLSRTFNMMVERLSLSRQKLESDVQKRTAELESLKGSLERQVNEKTKELQGIKGHLEEEVARRTQELEEKLFEVEKLNKLMVGREVRMFELKEKIKQYESGAGTHDPTDPKTP